VTEPPPAHLSVDANVPRRRKEIVMKLEHAIRRLAGLLVLAGLALGLLVSPWFFILVGFVGVNLFQSSYTGFCPAEIMLRGRVSNADAPRSRFS
jgi:DUF2892 family protein